MAASWSKDDQEMQLMHSHPHCYALLDKNHRWSNCDAIASKNVSILNDPMVLWERKNTVVRSRLNIAKELAALLS